ncbi:MAG: peptide ligase PGM1-related protein [Saprospiraceae bacterium]
MHIEANDIHIQEKFSHLQDSFIHQYASIFGNHTSPRCVIVIPSLTLDQQILSKIKGHFYYEERMLCMLMLLKMPETYLTFVTSIPISSQIIDYYLHMLPGVSLEDARRRLTLLSCYDAGNISLTEKVLKRPRIVERIKSSIPDNYPTHLTFFNVTELERSLAVKLEVPIYGCDPELNYLGTKTGSRSIFHECSVLTPYGYEGLKTEDDIIQALVDIKKTKPDIQKAVIKMNDGFSGDGNAIFYFHSSPEDHKQLYSWIKNNIAASTKIVAAKLKYTKFIAKFESMGGIVEEFISGDHITSPSVQCRINPLGETCIISTHDQLLGGESGQVFLGATFPASSAYAVELASISHRLSDRMGQLGVRGRFGIDFMSTYIKDAWVHYAIEINLRKGGTTHPYIMLQFLTNGEYIPEEGRFKLEDGSERFYFATDNLENVKYKGLTPMDLLEITLQHNLHYDHGKQEGVMFHLISALSQFGKIGLVSIGRTMEDAMSYYDSVVKILDNETNYTE